EQRKKLWEEAWKKQKDLYAFPSALSDMDDKYFGDGMPVALRTAFWSGDTYTALFDEMAQTVTPTQFAGGANAVLRPQAWSRTPWWEGVWLAMEDVGVKRELLKTIVAVNKEIGTFKPVTKDKPLERKFRSRIWELDLKVVTRGPDRFFQGTLKNLS